MSESDEPLGFALEALDEIDAIVGRGRPELAEAVLLARQYRARRRVTATHSQHQASVLDFAR